MAATKAVELIVSGKVQRVGYREFVAEIAQDLKLAGFVENLKDGTVRIWCKGEAASVDKFKELINVKNPPEAPLICVKTVAEKKLEEKQITEVVFEEKYGDPTVELIQSVSTGSRYMGHLSVKIDNLGKELGGKIDNLGKELGGKIDNLSTETKSGFGKMDTNFQELNVKYGKISTTMDRIDKNIEKIATKKKGIF